MIVRSREEQLEALKKASSALSDINFTSAYCSHHDPDFKDIIDFDDFQEVVGQVSRWVFLWEKKLKEIEMKDGFMKIQATFKGPVESLGYKPGSTYELILLSKGAMSISRLDGTGLCPYQSISAFLNNWTDIKHI